MPTNGLTSFALVGAGGFGTFVLSEPLHHPSLQITIVFRSLRPVLPQVTLKLVDFTSASSLALALAGIDVVISTVGVNAVRVQYAIARAVQEATVRLFVPSKFATPSREGDPVNGCKARFPRFGLSDLVGFRWGEGKVNIIGQGDTRISFTHRIDVARFLVHALTSLPLSRLSDRTLRISGDNKTLNEVVPIYRRTHPLNELVVTHESLEDAEAFARKHGVTSVEGIVKSSLIRFDKGGGRSAGEGEKLSTGIWEEWRPRSVEDCIRSLWGVLSSSSGAY